MIRLDIQGIRRFETEATATNKFRAGQLDRRRCMAISLTGVGRPPATSAANNGYHSFYPLSIARDSPYQCTTRAGPKERLQTPKTGAIFSTGHGKLEANRSSNCKTSSAATTESNGYTTVIIPENRIKCKRM
jgi:hypothetical protein